MSPSSKGRTEFGGSTWHNAFIHVAAVALKQLLDVEPADTSETAQPSPRFN